MSRRREMIERQAEREEEWLEREYASGRLSWSQYNEGMRQAQKEAQEAARWAMDEDMQDVMDDWR